MTVYYVDIIRSVYTISIYKGREDYSGYDTIEEYLVSIYNHRTNAEINAIADGVFEIKYSHRPGLTYYESADEEAIDSLHDFLLSSCAIANA